MGSYSVPDCISVSAQIPTQLNSYLQGIQILSCLHFCSKPNSIPIYRERGPMLSPSLLFCSNPNPNLVHAGGVSPTLSLYFVQIPTQFLFMGEGVPLYLCLQFLLKSQPNSIPIYKWWGGSYSESISTFCSNTNSAQFQYMGVGNGYNTVSISISAFCSNLNSFPI